MPKERTISEPVPPSTDRPLRQILVFLCSTYAIAVAIAVALPHAGITPLASIAAPLLGFAITLAVAVPRGQRRVILATVGFHPRRGRGLLIAVVGPVLIGALSFGVAAAFGVIRFPGLGAVSAGRRRPSSPASSTASSICRYCCSPPPIKALVNAGSWCRW